MRRYKSEAGRELIYHSYEKLLEDWNIEYVEQDIMTSYGSTHVVTAGAPENPPLLLLHGTADNTAMMWIYNIQRLSERFFVIAVDAIGGSGKSEPNVDYYVKFDQTVWLDEVLNGLGIERIYVAGVSYGAYLAYHYAIMRPEKVIKIICMAGGIAASQAEVMGKMMKAFLPEALFPSEGSCRRLLRKLSGPNYTVFESNAELMKHWYYLLKYFNNKSMAQHKLTIFNDEQISSIRDKSRFLIGDQDMLSNYPKSIQRLEAHGLNYRIVNQAGHAINHEQAEEIDSEIIQYFIGS